MYRGRLGPDGELCCAPTIVEWPFFVWLPAREPVGKITLVDCQCLARWCHLPSMPTDHRLCVFCRRGNVPEPPIYARCFNSPTTPNLVASLSISRTPILNRAWVVEIRLGHGTSELGEHATVHRHVPRQDVQLVPRSSAHRQSRPIRLQGWRHQPAMVV